MSRAPQSLPQSPPRRGALTPGVEYEFERLTISRELSRSAVTRLLTDRAERGGWELDRLRLSTDGTRRVVLRRKIIRQTRTPYLLF
jgi:phage gp46-like protein